MNQMNGTFTLAFVEEDNKQRVIFRVAPLSTREGITFRNAMEAFPDEGSLRVVPDKREQSTFKERMRAMGSLCVISLTGSEGKELVKVRQNKNYDPGQGEKNQLAIYSDVIQEFAEGAVFEVLSWNKEGVDYEAEKLLTKEVLLLSNKVLYGPVPADQIACVELAELKPFGNDRFLLHTVELPDHGVHTVYWNPEETINWRQRRGSLHRRGDKGAKEEKGGEALPLHIVAKESHLTEIAADLVQALPKEVSPLPLMDDLQSPKQERPVFTPEDVMDEALPIGARLSILDADISFDEQLSKLNQPVSDHANHLNAKVAAVKLNDTKDSAARFLGTPLVREARQGLKTVGRPEPLHQVVEQQLKVAGEERSSGELKGVRFSRMENPIENLLLAVEEAWQDRDTRAQAVAALVENQGFVDSLMEALRRKGQDPGVVAAAYAQLEELEAERFQILVQLDLAKTEQRKYKEELLTATSQKKREEIEALRHEVHCLTEKKQDLEETLRELSFQTQDSAQQVLAQKLTSLGGIAQDRVLISPVVGKRHEVQEMVDRVHGRMNARGFQLSEDDALSLLILFSQFPAFCLQASSLGNAQFFAATFLEALGLQSVSSTLHPNAFVEIASLLPEDERRTPTVTLQLAGTQALSVFGHRTLYLASALEQPQRGQGMEPACPVMRVPQLTPQNANSEIPLPALNAPAALSSFTELGMATAPLLEEWERWFEQFQRNVMHAEVTIPETTLLCMRRFVSVACQTHREGFLDAVDRAMSHWVVPQLIAGRAQAARAQEVLKGLPRSLEAVLENLPL
ncbi:MAG: hypothetical protein VB099_15850 [Candidatus Limiplasma sp.]|nr:hypothetical protein [Candidatus Limiplasma sp.]